MSGIAAITETIRKLREDNDDLRRRFSSLMMVGKVVEVNGDKERLEFADASTNGGEAFRSPLIRRANASGSGTNGHKERCRSAIGETRIVFSPFGELGSHSRSFPYGATDENQEPQGDDDFPRIFSDGNSKIAMKDGETRISVGDALIVVSNGQIRASVGDNSILLNGSGFFIDAANIKSEITSTGMNFNGGSIHHNGRNIGSDHTHYGVRQGNDNTDIPNM